MASPRWKQRPTGSTWGDWGPDDQLGRLNLLTPDAVRRGVAEVHEGLAFCLSMPLDRPGGNGLSPRRHPPVVRPTLRDGRPNFLCMAAENATDVVNDDLAIIHLQYSTQWDSFAHVGSLFDADADGRPEMVFYNGFRGGTDIRGPTDGADAGTEGRLGRRSTSAATALGIERMAERCVQGRGVLIDLHAHFGDARTVVSHAMLMQAIAADGVVVEPGDMVCLHTGYAQRVLDANGTPDHATLHESCSALDGRDPALLDWVTQSGLSVLIADNYAVEALPSQPGTGDPCAMLPLHEHCLFKLGVHLGELWHLTPLAAWLRAHGRSRFLLTAPPLRLPGAVGSPATPVATV